MPGVETFAAVDDIVDQLRFVFVFDFDFFNATLGLQPLADQTSRVDRERWRCVES